MATCWTTIHITLETFPGYKAVEINNYTAKNEKYINKKIRGIYGPFFNII